MEEREKGTSIDIYSFGLQKRQNRIKKDHLWARIFYGNVFVTFDAFPGSRTSGQSVSSGRYMNYAQSLPTEAIFHWAVLYS